MLYSQKLEKVVLLGDKGRNNQKRGKRETCGVNAILFLNCDGYRGVFGLVKIQQYVHYEI